MREARSLNERRGAWGLVNGLAANPAGRLGLLLVCALPIISGLVGRIARGRPMFTEFDSIACAGVKVSQGMTPYEAAPACDGMHPQPFVYLPQVAEGAAHAIQMLGVDGFRAVYLGLYAAALATIAYVVFVREATPGRTAHRILFLALISESAVTVGNIAIPIAAALLLCALDAPRRRLPMAAAIAAGAVVKPFQIAYAAVLALAGRGGVAARIGWAIGAGLAGLAAFAGAALAAGAEARADWLRASTRMALDMAPGEGAFGWLAPLGLGPAGLVLGGFVCAAIVCVAGLIVAERSGMEAKERLWLGLSVATLATPRLMQIDLFLIGPGLLVLAEHASRLPGPAGRFAPDAVIAGPLLALGLSVVGLDGFALKAAMLAFAAGLLMTAFTFLAKGRVAAEPAH